MASKFLKIPRPIYSGVKTQESLLGVGCGGYYRFVVSYALDYKSNGSAL